MELNILQRSPGKNICFDTSHAFAAGYNLRIEGALNETVKQLDQVIGLEELGWST